MGVEEPLADQVVRTCRIDDIAQLRKIDQVTVGIFYTLLGQDRFGTVEWR